MKGAIIWRDDSWHHYVVQREYEPTYSAAEAEKPPDHWEEPTDLEVTP